MTRSRERGQEAVPALTGFDPARMVGRVAQVLWDQRCPAIRLDAEDILHYEAQALEVIAAMREPTDAMLQTACLSHLVGKPMSESSDRECTRIANARTRWQRMIDAAIVMEAATAGETCNRLDPKDGSAGRRHRPETGGQ